LLMLPVVSELSLRYLTNTIKNGRSTGMLLFIKICTQILTFPCVSFQLFIDICDD